MNREREANNLKGAGINPRKIFGFRAPVPHLQRSWHDTIETNGILVRYQHTSGLGAPV